MTQAPSIIDESVPAAQQREATRDFWLLWVGQTASVVGDQAMRVGLPLVAVTFLGVSAAKAALLPFALFLPFLLLGLQAGAIVDRVRKRPVMLISNLAEAACYVLVVALAWTDQLTYELLFVLVALGGAATVFFQVAYSSILPSILHNESELQRGNARLFLSESLARTGGPMIAGPLIAATTAMSVVVANGASLLASAATILRIRSREPEPERVERQRGWIRADVQSGLNYVRGHPIIEPVISCGAIYVLFLSMIEASIVLYCIQVLGLSAFATGIVVGASALGYPVGNVLSTRFVNAVGNARTLVIGATISVTGIVLIPVAGSVGSVVGLTIASAVHSAGEGLFGPTSLTLRQTLTPPHLLARVNAVQRTLIWGAVPIGSLLAAISIATMSISAAMWIGAIGTIGCLPLLVRRDIRRDIGTPHVNTDTTPERGTP